MRQLRRRGVTAAAGLRPGSGAGGPRQGAQQLHQAEAEGEGWQVGGPLAQGARTGGVAPCTAWARLRRPTSAGAPQVRPVAEDEMFKVLRTGKRKQKQWKRMVTKVTFVGQNFTRKPPKYERFIRPTGAPAPAPASAGMLVPAAERAAAVRRHLSQPRCSVGWPGEGARRSFPQALSQPAGPLQGCA